MSPRAWQETLPTPTAPSIFDRAMSNLRVAWREIAARVGGARRSRPSPTSRRRMPAASPSASRSALANRGGEVSARPRLAEIGRAYLGLSPTGRLQFLKLLADNFGPDRARIEAAVARLSAGRGSRRRLVGRRSICGRPRSLRACAC